MTRTPVTTQSPKVVGLLPAYQAADFIERTLDALAAQTWSNFEVLASVDVCTDETAAIIRRRAERDSRFRVIEQTERHGWVGNVNFLINEAVGDYFFFAFHDDTPQPDYVRLCVEKLASDPDAVLAYTDMLTTYVNGDTAEHCFPLIDGVASAEERARIIVSMAREWATPNRGVFRAAVAKRVGGMKKHKAGEFIADWPWLLSLALEGKFLRAPGLHMNKNYMAQSLSQSWNWDIAKFNAAADLCADIVARSDLPVASKRRLTRDLSLRRLKTAASVSLSGLRRKLDGR
jgi:glycosyltransferase involved in cell wall biosynthesis